MGYVLKPGVREVPRDTKSIPTIVIELAGEHHMINCLFNGQITTQTVNIVANVTVPPLKSMLWVFNLPGRNNQPKTLILITHFDFRIHLYA